MLQNHATIAQIRRFLLNELRLTYSENESSSIARLILEHVGYPSSVHLHDPNRIPETATRAQITEIVSEIHTGKPIQYILGYTFFCDMKIHVTNSVLIPRPETEEMLHHINTAKGPPGKRMVDLGTGSGCIPLALKKEFPEADVSGIDFSREALEISKYNGQFNSLSVNWIQGNMLDPDLLRSEAPFNLVVSNPPYVLKSERQLMTKNVLDFEPGSALFVNDSDPLIYFRSIATFCKEMLESGGVFWVEINERFGRETARIFNKAGFEDVAIIKDIHGKERFVNGNL
jgi:release factor glutamine methyltransferase